jgi:hypothetical protein
MEPDQFRALLDALSSLEGAVAPAGTQEESRISWLTLLVAATGIGIAWFQLRRVNDQLVTAIKSYEDDHARSRRHGAWEVVQYFVEQHVHKHNRSVTLIEKLSDDTIRRLWDGERVDIPVEYLDIAKNFLREFFPDIDQRYKTIQPQQKLVTLTLAESMRLRFLLLEILNITEVCLLPWHLNIVDRRTIEEQLCGLVAPIDGKYRLQDARRILEGRGATFPASKAFRHHLFPDAVPSGQQPLGQHTKT